jgi:hypothetical protein
LAWIDEIKNLPGAEEQIRKYRYAQIGQAVALMLALSSEIEMPFNFGLGQEALFAHNPTELRSPL